VSIVSPYFQKMNVCSSGQHSCFVFGRAWVQFLNQRPTIQTWVWFPSSVLSHCMPTTFSQNITKGSTGIVRPIHKILKYYEKFQFQMYFEILQEFLSGNWWYWIKLRASDCLFVFMRGKVFLGRGSSGCRKLVEGFLYWREGEKNCCLQVLE